MDNLSDSFGIEMLHPYDDPVSSPMPTASTTREPRVHHFPRRHPPGSGRSGISGLGRLAAPWLLDPENLVLRVVLEQLPTSALSPRKASGFMTRKAFHAKACPW